MCAQPVDRHWFITLNGKRYGPYTFAALTEAAAKGVITGETRVWRLGWVNWHPAENVPGLIDAPEEGEEEIDAPDLVAEAAEVSAKTSAQAAAPRLRDRRHDERNERRNVRREILMQRARAATRDKKDDQPVGNPETVHGADGADAANGAGRGLIHAARRDPPRKLDAAGASTGNSARTVRPLSPRNPRDKPRDDPRKASREVPPDLPHDASNELGAPALTNASDTAPPASAPDNTQRDVSLDRPPSPEGSHDPNVASVELRAVREAPADAVVAAGDEGLPVLPPQARDDLPAAPPAARQRGWSRRLAVPTLVAALLMGAVWGLMASGIVIVVRPPWLDRWIAAIPIVAPGAHQSQEQRPPLPEPPSTESAQAPPASQAPDAGQPAAPMAPAEIADSRLPAAIAALPAVVALKRTDPSSFAKFAKRFTETAAIAPDDQILALARTALRKSVKRQLANAPGEMLVEITEAYLGYMQGLQFSNPESCVALSDESKGASLTVNLQKDFPALFTREMAVLERIASVDPGTAIASLTTDQARPFLQNLFTTLRQQPVQNDLLGRSRLTSSEFQPYCSLVIAFYGAVLALPADQRINLLRYLYAAAAADPDDNAPVK
jgi:hypothetical protein